MEQGLLLGIPGSSKGNGMGKRNGSALLVAVLVVILVMGLGLAFMGESIFRTRQEMTERSLDTGLRMCDAAVEQARRFLHLYRNDNSWPWPDILRYNETFPHNNPTAVMALWVSRRDAGRLTVNGFSETVAQTWPEAPVPADKQAPATPSTVFGVFSEYLGGTWFMSVRDNLDEPAEGALQDPLKDTDDVLIVSVTAILRDRSMRAVEACLRFEPPNFAPKGAIVTNGTANIYGNLTISTAPGVENADVISNGNLIFNGNSVSIQGKASAYGTITGAPSGVRDGFAPNSPKAMMPIGDPEYYKPLAAYILKSDGSVVNQAGASLSPPGAPFYNFSHSGGGWSVTSETPQPPAGVYYIEGDFDMTGNGRFSATLIVTGSVNVRGNSTGWDIGAAMGNVCILAGKDFKMNGNSTLRGVVVAGEQISMSGNATVDSGALIALDKGDASSLVSSTSSFDDAFGGSSTITYPGPQSTFLQVPTDCLELIYTRRIK